ncbi:TetR/AcrR family transcriptional regulator [Promicromonospora sukumoe]|uniref:AcrR family transcriptional regulator n=1 Tax=Promicromonospora sukumoe TaxID=88382 RepID=A0A7W3PDL8_9MICO|nr:TetR/AcrR family transcriptional regulator [Promicromonospora sukumoe]MBA8807687.1 AcrR family transcriptional regulator [Promicromonospora sukumoe]
MATAEKRPRADAVRNFERLLGTAREQFEARGAEMVFEDVARAAGLGKGTLYRHFPTRDHLLAALLSSTFDGLAGEADRLLSTRSHLEAYVAWLGEFDRMPAPYRGLRAVLMESLGDDASALAVACEPLKRSFAAIVAAVQREGLVRGGIDPDELMTVVAALPDQLRRRSPRHPWLDVVIDGTLTDAGRQARRT